MNSHAPRTTPRNQAIFAFTLTELLVTVAILGVLAALLLPTLAKARSTAQRTRCLANMRQIAVAYFAHAQDRGRTLEYQSRGDNSGWVDVLRKEHGLSNDKLFHCPMCYKNNRHALGNAHTAWRYGNAGAGELAGAARPMLADTSALTSTLAAAVGGGNGAPGMKHEDWARNPQYYAFVAGGLGPCRGTVEFTLKFGDEDSQCALSQDKEGGTIVLLLLCENLWPTNFSLEVWDAATGQSLHQADGLSVGTRKSKDSLSPGEIDRGDGNWELFEWAGPLSYSLGGAGSLLSPEKPFHTQPAGFDQATFIDRSPLHRGTAYPSAPEGRSNRNLIYMRTQLHSDKNRTLKVVMRGDDSVSAFVLRGGCCTRGPGSPCEMAKPATSTYSINAWAQSQHPLASSEGHRFYERVEQGHSEVPIFAEGIWADLLPRASDDAPTSLHGSNGGLSRACIDRHEGAINTAFMDGSVRLTKLPSLWALPWHKDWKAPAKAPALPRF